MNIFSEPPPIKSFEDAVNEVNRITEEFKNRNSISNPRLTENYLNGNVIVHIHFRMNNTVYGLKTHKWCAILKRDLNRNLSIDPSRIINGYTLMTKGICLRKSDGGNEQSVLVNVV